MASLAKRGKSRQFKNGKCSCWDKVEKKLKEEGCRLDYGFSFTGHPYLKVSTERVDGKRRPAIPVFCSY